MGKKLVIVIGTILVLLLTAIFIYRYQIFQYTVETLIRKNLPDYVKIDTIKFDFRKGDLFLGGFKISNPPGFSKEYLVEIDSVACHYKMRGKTIVDGIELSGPVLSNAVLNIERLGSGKSNLVEIQAVIGEKNPAVSAEKGTTEYAAERGIALAPASEKREFAGAVTLPEKFIIKSSKAIFTDGLNRARPNIITFENIDAEVALKMNEYYTKILSISSTGAGEVNGDKYQTMQWTIVLDPTTPRLTMSNRLEASGVVITTFEPYYDRYSPFVFKAGRFSGLLIFDFDNGSIGSSNELRLSGLKFSIKPGYENMQFLETTVPDIAKYFTTPYGEIIFDFKLKGDMADPKFYLGTKSRAALIYMAVDKASAMIQKNTGSAGEAQKNDIDKAKEYLEMFKSLMKK